MIIETNGDQYGTFFQSHQDAEKIIKICCMVFQTYPAESTCINSKVSATKIKRSKYLKQFEISIIYNTGKWRELRLFPNSEQGETKMKRLYPTVLTCFITWRNVAEGSRMNRTSILIPLCQSERKQCANKIQSIFLHMSPIDSDVNLRYKRNSN